MGEPPRLDLRAAIGHSHDEFLAGELLGEIK